MEQTASSPVTIKKELTSFSGVWTWGVRMGLLQGAFPNKGLRFPKTEDKSPFQTWAEIERQLELGGRSETVRKETVYSFCTLILSAAFRRLVR